MTAFLRMLALIAAICLSAAHAMAAEGLTTIKSNFGPKDTMNRLEAEVKARGRPCLHTSRMIEGQRQLGCRCVRTTF